MQNFVLFTAVLFLGIFSQAQNGAIENDLDQELDQVYTPPRTVPSSRMKNPVSSQPIYVVNQAQSSPQVQKQPTTFIEASPLNRSRADQMREARQQVEGETETRIVEKLEQSRIDDEKRRASVLFGEGFNQLQNGSPQATPSPMAQPAAPLAPPAPAPVQVQVVQPEPNRDLIREEVRAAISEEEKAVPSPTESRYFSAIGGMGEYPDVRNVHGNYVLGAAFGNIYDDTYAVEGGFTYSNYSLEKLDGFYVYDPYYGYVPRVIDVHQYGLSVAVKYMFLSGMVKPILGGLVQYSYRTFEWSNEGAPAYGYNYNSQNQDANSHAIDVGLVTGVDLALSPKFTLGVDFRYLFNLSSRTSSNGQRSVFNGNSYGGTPIEKLQYYNLGLAARVMF